MLVRGTMQRRPTKLHTTGIALAIAAALALGGRPARAQGADDKAAAESLFDEGKKLFLEKKFAEACPRLESSQRLDPGIGTLLYLADCYEGLGRVASAWATFREAAGAARAANQGERETVARSRAALLEPKLFKLTVAVPAGAPASLKVTRNDADVRREVWNADVPVDPGAYTLRATAPGKKPWSLQIQIPAGPGAQTVTVPPLEDEPVQAPPPTPPPVVVAPPPAAPPPPAGSPGKSQRIAGGVVTGVGGLSLAIGAVMGLLASSKNSDAKTACPNIPCSNQTGVDDSHQAGTFADASTGLFVVGGAAAVAGVIVILTAPRRASASSPAASAAWRVAPVIAPGTLGFSAGRAF
jgi:hypothetical protein